MWVSLLVAAVTPGFSLLTYFYLKDRYDAEPIRKVFKLFMIGLLLVFPTMFVQRGFVLWFGDDPFVFSFIISAGVEEFLKWFVIYYTVFHQSFFNEPYDGVVYTVAISLGFATLENVLYAFAQPAQPFTLLIRALLPVTGHALFAVVMGYYFGKSKFQSNEQANSPRTLLILALLLPIILHGVFDYIQLAMPATWMWMIIPFVAFLWVASMILVRKSLEKSPFRYVMREETINVPSNGS